VRLADGRTRSIVWPTVGVWAASTPGGDVVLVLGPEPALRWRLFTEQLIAIARRVGAGMVLTVGALLADVAHSRAVQVMGTATDQDVVDRFDLQRSRYEGPTGIVGVLHDACQSAGLPSASLWAAVPAYASQVPSPKAALALVTRACEMVGTPAPVGQLANEATAYEQRVSTMVGQDDDLLGYVSRLESIGFDELDDDNDDDDDELDDVADSHPPLAEDDLDSDELMAEVEQFLREQPEQ
jgi:proteasome assembly chaperone (PAC2) family protein